MLSTLQEQSPAKPPLLFPQGEAHGDGNGAGNGAGGGSGKARLRGDECLRVLAKSGLAPSVLAHICRLADVDSDGCLSEEEFVLAMHLANERVTTGVPLPAK